MIVNNGIVGLTHDGTALAKYLRVVWSGSLVTLAGATDIEVGTTSKTIVANQHDSTLVPVIPNGHGSTRKMVAAGAFAKGANIYGAANGKVDDTVNARLIGIAMEAAGADGDIVEIMPVVATAVPA